MSLDICCIPLTGGRNNTGRFCVLGYSVWRKRDNRFLDPNQGLWGPVQVIAPLQEQGRVHEHAQFQNMSGMKGCYLPEFPVNYGPEPLDGDYLIMYHDRDGDMRLIGYDRQRITPPSPVPGRQEPGSIWNGSPWIMAVVVALGVLTALKRKF